MTRVAALALSLSCMPCLNASAQSSLAPEPRWAIDVESGAAFSGYNDVRIPGDGGTRFSLSEELAADPVAFIRLRVARSIGQRHRIGLLLAPLRLLAEGSLDRPVRFASIEFPAGAPLEGRYRFDSYRLSYSYRVWQADAATLRIGFTGKIRDASISLEGAGARAEKTNTGFVPLLNCGLRWSLSESVRLLLEIDALAAPQGRAEDVLAGVERDLGKRLSLRAGYRFLEGGADNEEVYTFALLHYVSIGAAIRL